ncbi:tryptophan 7-halogenase, partial [Stenotrophomonas maltophilia]
FWRQCRDMEVPDTLQRKIDLFAANGRIFREDDELFTEESWIQVFLGQGVIPRGYDPLVDIKPEAQVEEYLGNIQRVIAR